MKTKEEKRVNSSRFRNNWRLCSLSINLPIISLMNRSLKHQKTVKNVQRNISELQTSRSVETQNIQFTVNLNDFHFREPDSPAHFSNIKSFLCQIRAKSNFQKHKNIRSGLKAAASFWLKATAADEGGSEVTSFQRCVISTSRFSSRSCFLFQSGGVNPVLISR